MIDMDKEIIFREGWTLDGMPFDDFIKARAFDVIKLGYSYGLVLADLYLKSDMICFVWHGTKKAMKAWYTDQSVNMTYESEERRNHAIQAIMNK